MNAWPLVEFFDEVDSTMDTALDRARAGAPHGTTVVAHSQRRGRGRRGRFWHSAPGAGLWMTTVLRPADVLPRAASVAQQQRAPIEQLAIVAALAVIDGLASLGLKTGAGAAQVKWPNDVLVGGQKLAGILLQSDGTDPQTPVVCVGIGLNVARKDRVDLPEDVFARYVGLEECLQPCPPIHGICDCLVRTLLAYCDRWGARGIAPMLVRWRSLDALQGAVVTAEGPNGAVRGVAEGILDDGLLRVRTPGGLVCVSAGEVNTVRQPKGTTRG